jgi:outer membrane protein assembly factor BamB
VTKYGEGQRGSSVFYSLNDKMQVRSKSSIVMGLENSIHAVRGLEDGGYLAAGYSMGTDGRKDGWIVRLDKDGVIKWQRQYPRGAGAQFMAADTLRSDAFVVAGTAAPLIPGGARSGWVMAVHRDDGKIIWQRYLSGSLEFYGRDMLVTEDGIISVLLDAEVLVEEGEPEDESDDPLNYEEYVVESDFGVTSDDALITDHVRIVRLNPRGVLLKNEEYFNGEGTDSMRFALGLNGERIIVGSTNMVYTLNDAVQDGPSGVEGTAVLRRGRDAWLSAAVPVDRYDDPCKRKAYRAP